MLNKCRIPDYFDVRKISKSVTILAFVVMLASCTQIPQGEFETYRNNFNTARTASEEILLTMKVRANQVAEHPDNPAGPNVRREQLEERIAALDARLKAWELIGKYNDILVRLASGTDPAAIENDLTSLGNNLSTFGISSLTKLVEDVSPVFRIISQTVTMIDDFIKKEKFKEAVTAAKEPILEILDILRKDSDDIKEIEEQLIMLKQDDEYNELTRLVRRLRSMANTYAQSEELDDLLSQHNKSIDQLKEDDKSIIKKLKISHKPASSAADANAADANAADANAADANAADANAANANTANANTVDANATDANAADGNVANANDIETMKILVDQIGERISSYNAFADQVETLNAVMKEYNVLLTATQSSFVFLNTGVNESQRAATIAFLADTLNLRKAIIEYREAKQK